MILVVYTLVGVFGLVYVCVCVCVCLCLCVPQTGVCASFPAHFSKGFVPHCARTHIFSPEWGGGQKHLKKFAPHISRRFDCLYQPKVLSIAAHSVAFLPRAFLATKHKTKCFAPKVVLKHDATSHCLASPYGRFKMPNCYPDEKMNNLYG